MAQKTGKHKYSKCAKNALKLLKSWTEKGNPNVTHCESLLEAEFWAMRGRKYVAKKHYNIAIVVSARGGFIHCAALANERYGEFLFNDMKDREEAGFKLKEAANLYREWGAHAKADQVSAKYGYLWDSSSQYPSGILVPTLFE